MKRWSDEAEALKEDLKRMRAVKDWRAVGVVIAQAEARAGTEVLPHHLLAAARATRRSDMERWADGARSGSG